MFNIKKEVAVILLLVFLVPIVYAGILDIFREKNIEDITGEAAVTASINIGNNAPNITTVSLGGQSYAPTDGGETIIEVSFEANDAEGVGNLDNSTALVNVSYQSLSGAGLLTDSNTSCTSSDLDVDTINYTCEIQLQYFWDHTSTLAQGWTVDAQVSDSNVNRALNSSNLGTDGVNWTVTELIAINLSDTALAWASVAPADTNASSTTNETVENTGNSLSLDIRTTIIDLSSGSSFIPAANFSVFNITNTDKIECEFTNQTAAVTPGAKPLVGENNTIVFPLTKSNRRGGGVGNQNNMNYCLFDVPSGLAGGTYNTNSGGSWDITGVDSGE